MRLSFHGADRGVTGSCHLLEAAGKRVLVDCGMLQGSRELDAENAAPFGFDPKAVDFLLLTHAHLDHCGRLPLLYRQGFRGEVIATAATHELARLVVMDAAHLQDEEVQHRARVRERRGGPRLPPQPPLYTLVDAINSLELFKRVAEYGKSLAVAPGIAATFYDAGHILGSASILVEAQDGAGSKSVLFSGDIGNRGRPLLPPPSTPARADFVVMESTYGDRPHRDIGQSVAELLEVVTATFARGGNVVIPTFALERAQEILYVFHRGVAENQLPPGMKAFLDSPMAISAVDIFEHYPQSLQPPIAAMIARGEDPFSVSGLRRTRDRADSVAINAVQGGAVIMAGSGMCTGGRIRHHLRYNLPRPEASIVFVGYAGAGTPARAIIDGTRAIRLFDDEVPVRAGIHTLNGFSAHAGQPELVAWHAGIQGKRRTFIVHGEERAMAALAPLLRDTTVEIPQLHSEYEL
ncbi:MAG: MBL fold metallo-hydrolase [Alphaproteobacteria bacterium]|nr:MBL fold metallo-hydrolase [Alphaproteobacteria bacterium]